MQEPQTLWDCLCLKILDFLLGARQVLRELSKSDSPRKSNTRVHLAWADSIFSPRFILRSSLGSSSSQPLQVLTCDVRRGDSSQTRFATWEPHGKQPPTQLIHKGCFGLCRCAERQLADNTDSATPRTHAHVRAADTDAHPHAATV